MLYAMVTGNMPFTGETEDEIIDAILKKKLKFKDEKPVSKEFKDLLTKILTKDPEKRISMFEMQNHPWMELTDEEIEQSIEESKNEEEAKKEEPEEDLSYLSKLTLDDKSTTASSTLDPKDASARNKKGSPRPVSPRMVKDGSFNGSVKKKGKEKVVKKKKKAEGK